MTLHVLEIVLFLEKKTIACHMISDTSKDVYDVSRSAELYWNSPTGQQQKRKRYSYRKTLGEIV